MAISVILILYMVFVVVADSRFFSSCFRNLFLLLLISAKVNDFFVFSCISCSFWKRIRRGLRKGAVLFLLSGRLVSQSDRCIITVLLPLLCLCLMGRQRLTWIKSWYIRYLYYYPFHRRKNKVDFTWLVILFIENLLKQSRFIIDVSFMPQYNKKKKKK